MLRVFVMASEVVVMTGKGCGVTLSYDAISASESLTKMCRGKQLTKPPPCCADMLFSHGELVFMANEECYYSKINQICSGYPDSTNGLLEVLVNFLRAVAPGCSEIQCEVTVYRDAGFVHSAEKVVMYKRIPVVFLQESGKILQEGFSGAFEMLSSGVLSPDFEDSTARSLFYTIFRNVVIGGLWNGKYHVPCAWKETLETAGKERNALLFFYPENEFLKRASVQACGKSDYLYNLAMKQRERERELAEIMEQKAIEIGEIFVESHSKTPVSLRCANYKRNSDVLNSAVKVGDFSKSIKLDPHANCTPIGSTVEIQKEPMEVVESTQKKDCALSTPDLYFEKQVVVIPESPNKDCVPISPAVEFQKEVIAVADSPAEESMEIEQSPSLLGEAEKIEVLEEGDSLAPDEPDKEECRNTTIEKGVVTEMEELRSLLQIEIEKGNIFVKADEVEELLKSDKSYLEKIEAAKKMLKKKGLNEEERERQRVENELIMRFDRLKEALKSEMENGNKFLKGKLIEDLIKSDISYSEKMKSGNAMLQSAKKKQKRQLEQAAELKKIESGKLRSCKKKQAERAYANYSGTLVSGAMIEGVVAMQDDEKAIDKYESLIVAMQKFPNTDLWIPTTGQLFSSIPGKRRVWNEDLPVFFRSLEKMKENLLESLEGVQSKSPLKKGEIEAIASNENLTLKQQLLAQMKVLTLISPEVFLYKKKQEVCVRSLKPKEETDKSNFGRGVGSDTQKKLFQLLSNLLSSRQLERNQVLSGAILCRMRDRVLFHDLYWKMYNITTGNHSQEEVRDKIAEMMSLIPV